jgi:hypothetical protein
VPKVGKQFGLGVKKLGRVVQFLGAQAVALHLFDGPDGRQTLIFGQVNGTHAALAQNFHYLVATLEESFTFKHIWKILFVARITFAKRVLTVDWPNKMALP